MNETKRSRVSSPARTNLKKTLKTVIPLNIEEKKSIKRDGSAVQWPVS
jgi:hypothetical protein